MSSSWSEGYFTDATYCVAYYREQSPAFQRFCLLLAGYDAPKYDENSAFCELGFGQGLTLNINAACTPGEWHGNDFNPEHMCYAQSFSNACDSSTHLTDQSFAEFCHRDDLPQFDSVSLHGIWTWVSAENRQHILHFLNTHVKPGGVVYMSYNCNPGMASLAPIRQLLFDFDRHTGHVRSGQRVKAALDFAQKALEINAPVHSSLPEVRGKLNAMCSQQHIYLAHEFLNEAWDVMYFSDVAKLMGEARLSFATVALAQENVQGLGYTPEALEFLETIESPVLREQTKDYFSNAMFRRDLYMRGGMKLESSEKIDRLLLTRMMLCAPLDKVAYQVTVGMGSVGLDESMHKPLVAMLAEDNYRPKTIREIHTRAEGRFGEGQLIAACAALCGTGNVAPCQSEAVEEQTAATCSRLNHFIMERSSRHSEVEFLASPVLGAGVHLPRISQLFYLATLEGKDPLKEAHSMLKRDGVVLSVEGRQLTSVEEEMQALGNDYEQFKIRLPIYKAMRLA